MLELKKNAKKDIVKSAAIYEVINVNQILSGVQLTVNKLKFYQHTFLFSYLLFAIFDKYHIQILINSRYIIKYNTSSKRIKDLKLLIF